MNFEYRKSLRKAVIVLLLPAGTALAQLQVEAPEPLGGLLRQYLKPPAGDLRDGALEAYARDARKTAAELLATEGYFSPDIDARAEPGRLSLSVSPGPRTLVAQVAIDIRGELAPARRAALLETWPLKHGQPFRNADWNQAKQELLRALLAEDFPAARLEDSRAEIDPRTSEARLSVVYATGPRYVFGPLEIMGLARFPPSVVQRYSKIRPGAPYHQADLLALQAALQRTPYFSSVSVELGPPVASPGGAAVSAAVEVHVRERAPHQIALGAGYSTNTGARTELTYRGIDFLHRAWQLDAGLRLEQRRQSLYADTYLPPRDRLQDSFGVLWDREDIEGLRRRRIAFGAVRSETEDVWERRYALNWQREMRSPLDAASTTSSALTLDGAWTVRRVDDRVDPRRGYVVQLKAGGGTKALLSDQNFLRLDLRTQFFMPLGQRDVASVRGELGATLAPSRDGIPQDFLFRTGGAGSVRGYAYQSLGVREGSAIVGGRYLLVSSAEYTHWFTPKWGGAAFIDSGNAGDDRHAFSLATGYGIGARWKSPVGPLGADLAYGQRTGQWHVHFSLSVAF